MKQLLQNIKTGKSSVEEVPVPTPHSGQALVKVAASLVSAGTERMVVEFAEKSLVGKARSRPDLVRQVIDKARREGINFSELVRRTLRREIRSSPPARGPRRNAATNRGRRE